MSPFHSYTDVLDAKQSAPLSFAAFWKSTPTLWGPSVTVASHLKAVAKPRAVFFLPACVVVTVCRALLSHNPPAHDLFIHCPVRAGSVL